MPEIQTCSDSRTIGEGEQEPLLGRESSRFCWKRGVEDGVT